MVVYHMHAYDQFFRECKFWKDKENNGVKQKDWCENLNQGCLSIR